MRQLLTACAAFAASAALVAPAQAAPAAQAVPPGQVYFWPESNQMGGAWPYSPPGYREADPPLKRHAYSFDSHARVSVYAIHERPGGTCLYREIRPDDYDYNWTAWATKFDGVSDTTMGCEPG